MYTYNIDAMTVYNILCCVGLQFSLLFSYNCFWINMTGCAHPVTKAISFCFHNTVLTIDVGPFNNEVFMKRTAQCCSAVTLLFNVKKRKP